MLWWHCQPDISSNIIILRQFLCVCPSGKWSPPSQDILLLHLQDQSLRLAQELFFEKEWRWSQDAIDSRWMAYTCPSPGPKEDLLPVPQGQEEVRRPSNATNLKLFMVAPCASTTETIADQNMIVLYPEKSLCYWQNTNLNWKFNKILPFYFFIIIFILYHIIAYNTS